MDVIGLEPMFGAFGPRSPAPKIPAPESWDTLNYTPVVDELLLYNRFTQTFHCLSDTPKSNLSLEIHDAYVVLERT